MTTAEKIAVNRADLLKILDRIENALEDIEELKQKIQ